MWPQMAERIGIRELRDNLTSAIRRVRAGETFEISRHGEVVALLTPAPRRRIEQLRAAADVTTGAPLARPLRRHRPTGALTAGEALERDRDGR